MQKSGFLMYVGNFRDAKDQAQLKENNITHILSIHDNAKELLDVSLMQAASHT